MAEEKKKVIAPSVHLGAMRPYLGDDGKIYISTYNGGDVTKRTSYSEMCINSSPTPMMVNATLRRDEWKQLDEKLMELAMYRLGGWQDLLDKGLVYNIGNAMGTTVLEWHDVGDALSAELNMDGIYRGKNDQVEFQTNYLPLPITHSNYELNLRHLEASRKLGNALDTFMVERAVRKIHEKQENMLFTDTDYAYGTKDDRNRNKIYSYVNFPDRNIVALTTKWDASAKTAQGILNDVLTLKKTSIAAYHYGPWMMYIPTDYETVLDDDYDTQTPGKTIRERIMAISGISGIKVIDSLAEDTILLVEMKPDTVRIVNGFGLTNVEDKQEFGLITKYKVMTIQVPQIRSDQNGKCGIVHATLT